MVGSTSRVGRIQAKPGTSYPLSPESKEMLRLMEPCQKNTGGGLKGLLPAKSGII